MLKLDHKPQVLVLVAAFALVSAAPLWALDAAKPLDLKSFARPRSAGAPKPVVPASPSAADNGSARATAWAPEDTGPLMTGAVPAPENPPAAARPAKTGNSAAPPKPAPVAATAPPENEVAQFCSNVADPAVDARLAWQLKELEKAEAKLRERIAEVEAKRVEYEQWMALRDEFLKKAEASMVEIYSRMRPEAAATQIAGMADETAAAVLAKLSPRNASAIFNEMESARAAHLADLLGGMRRVDDGKTNR
ncbi:MotE family protein [Bradyrhizobium sp. Arg68]|uniref:MotE family protein n=1 Tax=Bradyrhizobium ivorense TaxID=2511166 RepID=UPI001E3A82D7|nr:MotE family protein [Bradyrhizobium ivorense]MCC8940543.1 MotE family protein [Bradyrhizobium ivorense]